MRDYILLIRTNKTGNSTTICVTTSVIAFDQNEILNRTKKNKTVSFDGITSVRAWTIIPHNARVFVYHAALWQAVVVVCAQMDSVDRKAMQIHRDEHSYLNFRYVSVLISPCFHIKYASENSCRRCVSLLESLEQRRRSNVAQSQTTLPSAYPSRKHKKPETNETTFEALQAFKTTISCTCTAFKKLVLWTFCKSCFKPVICRVHQSLVISLNDALLSLTVAFEKKSVVTTRCWWFLWTQKPWFLSDLRSVLYICRHF